MVRVFFPRVGSSSRPSFCSPLSAPPSLSSSCSSRSTWRSSCLGSDTCTATPRVCLPRPPSRPVVSSVSWLLLPRGITLWLVSWMIRTGECPSIDSTRSVILCCYLCRWRALIHAVFFSPNSFFVLPVVHFPWSAKGLQRKAEKGERATV